MLLLRCPSSCCSCSCLEPRRRRTSNKQRQARARHSILPSALIALSLARMASAQGLSFIWYFDQQNDASIPQCDTLDISIGPLDNITTQPVPPYYLISYPADATPSIFDASSANGGVFSWNMGYPPGTQLLLGMVDSKGNSGGIVRVYSVGAGASNCQMYSTTNDDFSFSINPSAQPRTCQDVDFTVTGGVPPYTVTTAVSMDNAINQTFTNSNISVKNVLTGGATYILALSDSTGSYAASSDLIYSGGGGDNSCLVTTPSTSSRPTKSATPDKGSSSSKGPAIIGSVVAICAVLLIAALVAFLMYRRKKKAQHQAFLAGRMNGMNGGGGYGPHGSDSDNGTYISSAYGSGREKFVSPMGSNSHNSGIAGLGGAAAGGGMWRPESPTEYPGITSAPVRFRVTNPDDDARSERSFKMLNGGTASTRGGVNGSSMRPSQDTVRSGSTGLPWRRTSSDGRSTTDRSQRQSLIESDANALYPPTSSYNIARGGGGSLPGNGVKSPNSPRLRLDTSNTSNGSSGSFEDADQPWPTYSSAASSETEDHYTDLPASSAGILGLHRGRIVSSSSSNMNTSISRNGAERTSTSRRRGTGSDEMDLEEMYRDEVYSSTRELENEEIASNSDFHHDPAWESFTRPSPHSQGMTPSPSNAYGSPFADSQRVRS